MKQFAWQGRQVSKIALGSTNFGEPMSISESWLMPESRESIFLIQPESMDIGIRMAAEMVTVKR